MRIAINMFGRHLIIEAGKDDPPEVVEPEALSLHGGEFGFGMDVPTFAEPEQRWH